MQECIQWGECSTENVGDHISCEVSADWSKTVLQRNQTTSLFSQIQRHNANKQTSKQASKQANKQNQA